MLGSVEPPVRESHIPVVSRFFGVVFAMFYDDHSPPRFHAKYSEHLAIVGINNLAVLRGHLPPRALALVIEWAGQHQLELRENWELARTHATLKSIEPLR